MISDIETINSGALVFSDLGGSLSRTKLQYRKNHVEENEYEEAWMEHTICSRN